MQLSMEPHPVLAVSLNSAWQKTLNFGKLTCGAVNRAQSCHEAGGGKGVNVARVFRQLGLPVAVAAFAGGHPGECLRREFAETGVTDLTVSSAGVTRCCYTVIDRERGEATELIEPSAPIAPAEVEELRSLLLPKLSGFGAVALCGTLPPGVPSDIYAELAAGANAAAVPVVLDAVRDIDATLAAGVTLLKINAGELAQLGTGATVPEQAADLLARFPHVAWLAVTDGPNPAWLLQARGDAWRISVPRLERIVSPIGGGDCATAIMTRRLAEGARDGLQVAQAFAEALACASASCLTDTPSLFDPAVAAELLAKTTITPVTP